MPCSPDAWRVCVAPMLDLTDKHCRHFHRLLTKRAHRIQDCLPADWGEGYENVMLQVTTENQARADEFSAS